MRALAPTQQICGTIRRPALGPKPVFRVALSVRAVSSGSGATPTPPDPTPRPPGTPSTPTPPVFLRTGSGPGAGGVGSVGGVGGTGGGGSRPVATGGSGGGDQGGGLPPLPRGWTWGRLLLAALGVVAAIPAWQYLNRRYIFKPEPEHTIAMAEDATHEGEGAVSKAVSAVKHATVDPIVHSEMGRAIQHTGEAIKDSLDIGTHESVNKAERTGAHVKKDVKHAAEDTKSKVEDVGTTVDSKGHEVKVKGKRKVQHAGEAVEDTTYEAKKGVGRTIKDAAKSVGRTLHLVADSTEKGTKKAVDKATGEPAVETSHSERKAAMYTAGGVALGAAVLGALYYWDKKGGDLAGKMKKVQDKTMDAMHFRTKDAPASTRSAPKGPPPTLQQEVAKPPAGTTV